MKLQAGRWYEDGDGKVHGPMEKLPKNASRRSNGMRFVRGALTWGKDGHYEYDRHSGPRDLIREVPAPSVASRLMNVCHSGNVAPACPVEPPTGFGSANHGLMARILEAARLTPVGQIGDDSLTSCQKQFYAEKAINDWAVQQKRLNELNAQAMPEPIGQHTAPPADPMDELCQSIVTDAANAAQAIRDKAVQAASEPARDDNRDAPPLVPKAIKRKKWGDWIEGPVDVWWNGRKVQAEVVPAILGAKVIRHRIKNPRE